MTRDGPVSLSSLALLGAMVLLWASAFPMIKLALEGMAPSHLTLLRHLIASAAFLPLLLLSRSRLWPRREDLFGFVGLGVIGITVYHLAINYGEVHVSAGATSLIVGIAPALTALVAWWLVGERMPLLGWAGSAVAIAGVALITLGEGSAGLHPAAAVVFLAPVSAAFFAVMQRSFLRRYRPLEVTAFFTWGGTLPLLVFLPGLFTALPGLETAPLWATAYLGVMPSAIAYTAFAIVLVRVSAPTATSFLYLIPVAALLMSWWWLGETPTWLTLVGGVVAVAGLLLIQWAKRTAVSAASAPVLRPRSP